jgi:DNA-binding Lrp family transcriptional regulator
MRADDQELLAALQRGIPLAPRPFAHLAEDLGCDEADVLDFIARCRAEGTVRRFGAVFGPIINNTPVSGIVDTDRQQKKQQIRRIPDSVEKE